MTQLVAASISGVLAFGFPSSGKVLVVGLDDRSVGRAARRFMSGIRFVIMVRMCPAPCLINRVSLNIRANHYCLTSNPAERTSIDEAQR
jgi:hypothetical protein